MDRISSVKWIGTVGSFASSTSTPRHHIFSAM